MAGFADTTGRFLPLVVTLNAARVLDAAAALLGVDHDELSQLALSAPAGADGLVLVPVPGGRAHPEPAARHRRRARPDPAHLDPGAPGPGRRRGHALRPRRRPGRAASRRAPRPAGSSWSAAAPSRGGAPDRAGALRLPGRSSRRPGSTSPTAPPGRPPGSPWAAPRRRPGRPRPPRSTRPSPSRRPRAVRRGARAVLDRRAVGPTAGRRHTTPTGWLPGCQTSPRTGRGGAGAPRSTASWSSCCSRRWTTWRSAWCRRCTAPIGDDLRRRRGGCSALVTAVIFLVSAVAAVGWAYAGDRTDRKPLLMLGTLIWAAGTGWHRLAGGYPDVPGRAAGRGGRPGRGRLGRLLGGQRPDLAAAAGGW